MSRSLEKPGRFPKSFLVLFGLYAGCILCFSQADLHEDEAAYIKFATNLTHGFFTSSATVDLWYGPGYPLVLTPLQALHAPPLEGRLLNAVFLVLAITYFYRTALLFVKPTVAYWASFLLGLYPPFFRELPILMTESLTFLLMTGFAFHFTYAFRIRNKKLHLAIASAFLGYLALTKVIFGYVIPVVALLSLMISIVPQWRTGFRSAAISCALALLFCMPYLVYTYSLSGRLYYWGNSGGLSLYWMSSPYPEEYGDWFNPRELANKPTLERNHEAFFRGVARESFVTYDDHLKEQAVRNIRAHPTKFAMKVAANTGRLLFSYPFSYAQQKPSTYFYIIPNMFIVVFALGSLVAYIRAFRMIPCEIHVLMLLFAVSFAASTLVSAYSRQFWPLVPILVLWAITVLSRTVRVRFSPTGFAGTDEWRDDR